MQLQPRIEQFLGCRKDFVAGRFPEMFEENGNSRTFGNPREGVDGFHDHIVRDEQRLLDRPRPSGGSYMQRVFALHERKKVSGVHEDHGRFGVP